MNIYKKSLKDIYSYIDLTKNIKRFNNNFKINGYHDTVLDHTARVTFLATELASYIEKHIDIDLLLLTRLCIFHDVGEVETGDISGRVKDTNKGIRELLEKAEIKYLKKILDQKFIDKLYFNKNIEFQLMKLADKYDVYLQMKYLREDFYKKSPQYKKISKVLKHTLNKIENMKIYKLYFKDILDF